MRVARLDRIEAAEQFAQDTDDPVAALATFRQVLAEAEGLERNALLTYVTSPRGGMLEMGRAFGQAFVLARGLAALAERLLTGGLDPLWGCDCCGSNPCSRQPDSTPPTNGGCYDEPDDEDGPPEYAAPIGLKDVLAWAELHRSTFDDGYVVWTDPDEDFLQALRDTVLDDGPEPTTCPDHGELSDDGKCWPCWYADLAVEAAKERRAFGE